MENKLNESDIEYKYNITIANVQPLNQSKTSLRDLICAFTCKSEQHFDKDSENGIKLENSDEIIPKSEEKEEEPSENSSHGLALDLPSNNVDEETTEQVGADSSEMDVNNEYIKENINKTIEANELTTKSKLCKPSPQIGTRNTSYFRQNHKRVHGNTTMYELNHLLSKTARLQESIDEITKNQEQQSCCSTSKTTTTAAATSATRVAKTINKQMEFGNSVLNYFLSSFTPLCWVETPDFRSMMSKCDASIPHVSKAHLAMQMNIKLRTIKNKIISLLDGVDYVCIATDPWLSKTHSYVAITCHWIDAETFKRRSVTLACQRCESYSEILRTEDFFNQTLKNYNLSTEKIISHVTKNFYNFAKLFRDLNIPTPVKTDDVITEDNTVWHRVFFQTTELIPYVCYTKILSSIVVIDIHNVIESKNSLKHIHQTTLKKVFLFLSLASSKRTLEPLLADYKKPNISKWNSIYDSLVYFLKLEQKCPFAELFDIVNTQSLTVAELSYLREYVKCLGPMALAFERLQCEQGTYYGFIMPTILEFQKKYEKLYENNDLTLCLPIVKAILSKSMKRFDELNKPNLQNGHFIIASVSHPFFKENWVSAVKDLEKDTIKNIFIESMIEENPISNGAGTTRDVHHHEQDKCEDKIDDFYFGDKHQGNESTGRENVAVEMEALRYLADNRKNLKMLDDYPGVKRVFLKYNTSLTSSEPVEKIFPFETRQTIARYGCLEDELFEERILFMVNKDVLSW